MAETPTREELLEARIAYLEVWHQDSEEGHALAVAENNALRHEVGTLRLSGGLSNKRLARGMRYAFEEGVEYALEKRGCCKVDGGEDGGEGG